MEFLLLLKTAILTSTSEHTRHCHSYKSTWKDFHMYHIQYLLITCQFFMFSPTISYLKMQILKYTEWKFAHCLAWMRILIYYMKEWTQTGGIEQKGAF